MHFKTKAIHSHQAPCPVTGAVLPPLYQTTTFAFDDLDTSKGYFYTRKANPTIDVLQNVLADLESAQHGLFFSSGMGAISTMALALLKPGDHVLAEEQIYGGTYRLFNQVLVPYGVTVEYADFSDLAGLQTKLKPSTKLLFWETPTNPVMKIVDSSGVVAVAKQQPGILTFVDNTFASPYLQNPLRDDAVDIVFHSTTKYIGGHSDVIGGALMLNHAELYEKLAFHQDTVGANADPFAAWLTLRGLRTLGVRMQAHCHNAMELAHFLSTHPAVEDVYYPGLPSHPGHQLAKRQMHSGFGGMISIRLKGDEEAARQFLKRLNLFTLAVSLGGVESLVCHPATMTHRPLEAEVKERLGITDNLIRLSVGIEDLSDLKADLGNALTPLVGHWHI
jgi:cystathionine beta-lyase/cystathionine gamma-synthase